MTKVLILGGTGAMGVYLRDALSEIGYEVVVSSRKSHADYGRVRFIIGDGRDNVFLKTTLDSESPDAIVDFMDYPTEEFKGRLERLLNGTSHYLFLSSYRVFADNPPLTESSTRLLDSSSDAEFLETDEYSLHKAREEDALRASGHKNWTIVRPSITYSKERFQFGCLEADTVCYRTLQRLPVVIPSELLNVNTTMTWAGDVAKMISRLVLNPHAFGDDFNVVTAEHHTWGEVAEIYKRLIGLDYKVVPLDNYLRLCNPYQVRYDRMFDRRMDNSKVLKTTALAQQELMPLERGLQKELESFRKAPRYRYMNWRQNILMDKVCKTHIDLSSFTLREKFSYMRQRHDAFGSFVSVAASPR